ncbi:response regulator transcription factor [Myxococcota bacterium]|nr:response regulator transcription factor [Myxococcota bacterium]MBU1381087.1 response regulator transcription factor [Myxococcota bacterium]MBU1497164.1 response regulator transcription factor [Myxococcota bacterium]
MTRILLADDDQTSRNILKAILHKWGFEVIVASEGIEALDIMLSPQRPSIAILDWIMPGLEGTEICRKIREVKTDNPPYLILLTSKDSKDDVVTGLVAGANDYITKPFFNAELKARIDVGRQVVNLQNALSSRVSELQHALDHIKVLQGILPICMHCHKIRTDDESWHRLELYIENNTDAQFSHGLCPECMKKYYNLEDINE